MKLRIVFTKHAEERIIRRKLSKKQIIASINNPNSVAPFSPGAHKFFIKKKYYDGELDKHHVLVIVATKKKKKWRVITIIDTSKLKKYS